MKHRVPYEQVTLTTTASPPDAAAADEVELSLGAGADARAADDTPPFAAGGGTAVAVATFAPFPAAPFKLCGDIAGVVAVPNRLSGTSCPMKLVS